MVLVTRPEPGLSETLRRVEALGWDAEPAPVLAIEPSPVLPVLAGRALAITSAQSLPALAAQPRDRLLFTVGSATARRAEAMGFVNVKAAEGNARLLAELCQRLGVTGPELTLACGRGRQGEAYGEALAQELGAQWVQTYQVRTFPALPPSALNALQGERGAAILFYSSESVSAFLELCPEDLWNKLASLRCLCLSEAIAARACERLSWGEVQVGPPVEGLGQREG